MASPPACATTSQNTPPETLYDARLDTAQGQALTFEQAVARVVRDGATLTPARRPWMPPLPDRVEPADAHRIAGSAPRAGALLLADWGATSRRPRSPTCARGSRWK